MKCVTTTATGRNVAKNSVGVDPRLLPPPVVIQRALARVAGLAQASEVIKVVGAAVFERENVVNLLYGCVASDL